MPLSGALALSVPDTSSAGSESHHVGRYNRREMQSLGSNLSDEHRSGVLSHLLLHGA